MKLQSYKDIEMEVLYPGNLALLSMFMKKPEDALDKDGKSKGESVGSADVLTCGSCQKDFLLADILRFIQHKVHCQLTAGAQARSGTEGADAPRDDESDSPNKSTESVDKNGDVVSDGDAAPHYPPSSPDAAGPEETEGKSEDKRKREDDEDGSPASARKRVRSVQDAEANTTDTEPMRYTCGTCGSVLSTAWGLVQHVQSSHGIIIYQESSKSFRSPSPTSPTSLPKPSHSSPLSSVSSTATTLSGPMPPLPIPLLDPTKIDLSKIVSPATSGPTPLPPHPPVNASLLDPNHPFNLLRMPLGNGRVPFHPGLTPPFVRPGHDFRMDQLLQEGLRINSGLLPPSFERSPFLDPGLGASRLSAPTPVNVGGDPHLDIYSQRLRQLAGTTSPTSSTSPKKPAITPNPPFTSPNGPVSSNLLARPQTPTSTRSDSNSIALKPFKCEECSKCFQWESNLIIHRRIHSGDKDYKCSKCKEVLTCVSSLRSHLRKHAKRTDQSGNSPDSSRPQTEEDIENEIEENEDDDDEDDDEDTNPSVSDSMDDDDKRHYENSDDAPEDLSLSKNSSSDTSTTQNVSSSTNSETSESKNDSREPSKSVVGELMDKFGLSNISTYNDAYQQALKESGRLISQAMHREKIMASQNKNGIEKSLKLREDLTKGINASQPSLDLAHQTLLGAFDNPYALQNRISSASRDSSSLYAGLWLPNLGNSPNARDIFPNIPHSDANFISRKFMNDIPSKNNDSSLGITKPGSSSSSTSLSLMNHYKKDRVRNDTCEYCGKIFKNCSNLTVHRRSHTGEKPYKCDLCSYACAQSSKLTRHMKTHGRIGKDVYRCRFCDMPFSVASTLEKHMRKCVVNQNSKGIFPPISISNPDSLESSYNGFHLNPMIKNETSKSSSKNIFSSNSSDVPENLETTYKGFHLTSVIKDETSKGVNLNVFPNVSSANHENAETTYKGFHLTSVIDDDSTKSSGMYSPHLNVTAATASVPSMSNDESSNSPNIPTVAS